RTRKQILKIARIDNLLDDMPVLQKSLSRRDSYLDPLNHIQLGLLRHYRHTDLQEEEEEMWLRPLLRSINAISAGLRNTG
ncbi:MAG: phosphoenolpyruvate carboxylase, partial [Candidatus Thiodiazotropha endolucinida]